MTTLPSAPNRNLVIVRAGDHSLHPAGGTRNWDLHISHFGTLTEAPADLPPGVIWSSGERRPKWPGIADAIAAGLWSLDAYGWIAIADDDLIVEADAWSRAFDIARARNLPACQLSLLHGSFWAEPDTLRLPGLLLHFVKRVEQMAIIVRVDLFRRLIPFMSKPGNLWAMDHVLVHLAGEEAHRFAVLDTASALHTRRFWSGAAYQHYASGGSSAFESAFEEEKAFLAENHIPYVQQATRGGIDLADRPLAEIWWRWPSYLPARFLRKFREFKQTPRIASSDGETIWLLRRFAGVRLGHVNRRRVKTQA
jgi:hypothetical protein